MRYKRLSKLTTYKSYKGYFKDNLLITSIGNFHINNRYGLPDAGYYTITKNGSNYKVIKSVPL